MKVDDLWGLNNDEERELSRVMENIRNILLGEDLLTAEVAIDLIKMEMAAARVLKIGEEEDHRPAGDPEEFYERLYIDMSEKICIHDAVLSAVVISEVNESVERHQRETN